MTSIGNTGGPAPFRCDQDEAPLVMTVDGANLFWVNAGGSVIAANRFGGGRTTLATGPRMPRGVAVDDARVFWTAGGGVYSCSKTSPGEVEVMAHEQGETWGIAVDETHLYWADFALNRLYCGEKHGGAIVWHHARGPSHVVVGTDAVFFANRLGPGDYDFDDGNVASFSKPDATATVLFGSLGLPGHLTADQHHLYWVNERSSQLMRAPKSGGSPKCLVERIGLVWGLEQSGDYIYAIGPTYDGSGDLRCAPKAGGEPRTLVSIGDHARVIAVDGESVFVMSTSGTLHSVPAIPTSIV